MYNILNKNSGAVILHSPFISYRIMKPLSDRMNPFQKEERAYLSHYKEVHIPLQHDNRPGIKNHEGHNEMVDQVG